MGFRDDELAGRERIDVLERELASLKEENEELRKAPKAKGSGLSRVALIVSVLGLLVVGGAVAVGWRVPTHGDDLGIALSFVGAILLVLAILLAILSRLLIVVPAGRILVVSGRQRRSGDGSVVGYRVVVGGRTIRIPLIEIVDELAKGPFRIDIYLRGAYARGNERVDVRVRGLVKVASHEPMVNNAIERFLGRDGEEIAQVARDVLEGALRSVTAELTIEQLREDRLKVADVLVQEAEQDFRRLGLELDTFHVLEVEPS